MGARAVSVSLLGGSWTLRKCLSRESVTEIICHVPLLPENACVANKDRIRTELFPIQNILRQRPEVETVFSPVVGWQAEATAAAVPIVFKHVFVTLSNPSQVGKWFVQRGGSVTRSSPSRALGDLDIVCKSLTPIKDCIVFDRMVRQAVNCEILDRQLCALSSFTVGKLAFHRIQGPQGDAAPEEYHEARGPYATCVPYLKMIILLFLGGVGPHYALWKIYFGDYS